MKNITKWAFLFMLLVLVGFGGTLLAVKGAQTVRLLSLDHLGVQPVPAEQPAAHTELVSLPAIAPAAASSEASNAVTLAAASGPSAVTEPQLSPNGPLSAVGVIEVMRERQVVLSTSGKVKEIPVEVGDTVKAGDTLVTLDTTYLDWAVEQAQIAFDTARLNFEALGQAEPSDVDVAKADLLLAQENLADVQRGPTKEELAAADSSNAAAWARYQELKDQPTQEALVQAQASLKKAQINVQQAQREYDKIAWLPEAAASQAADNLQSATVDLEAAKAAYAQASKPATEAELQSALSSAQSAQDKLNQLQKEPTPAQSADAKAKVASAQAALDIATRGAKEVDLKKGQLSVRDAMIGLDQARLALKNATVSAPIDGTILSLNVELGEQASSGTVVATIANTTAVKLTVNVEQKDISKVHIGQIVNISIYALPDIAFKGVVDKIAPVADSGTGFVTFPVIIHFTEGAMDKILPGMTASAVFLTEAGTPAQTAPVTAPAVEMTAPITASLDVTSTYEITPALTLPEPTATLEITATTEPAATMAVTATVESTSQPTATIEASGTPEPTAEPTKSTGG